MLTTSVERLEGTTVKLTVTVPASDVNASIAEAYGAMGKKLRIPGFRKGHAPRPVVDNYVGREYVLAEATEGLVNDWYPRAVDAENLRPIESPELGELDTVQPDTEYTFTVEVELRPEFELDSYDDIKVEVPRREVNDADIDEQLVEIRERFASLQPVEDRGIQTDDFVLLSFIGYVDGETYEGNEVDKYLYEMGRGLMPPEFDEAILGLKSGSEARVEFTIPDTSSNEEYVGKQAQFDVTIHEVKAKVLPEVDDAFAGEMGFETVELMREDMRGRLDVQRLMEYDRAKEKRSREVLAARVSGDIPKAMIDSRATSLENDFNARLRDQGMTLEQYAGITGLTQETFRSELAADAEQLVREDLALEALFRKLGFEVTDADLEEELKEISSASKMSVEEAREKWKAMGLMAVIAEGVMHRRAVGWLMENVEAVETDEKAPELFAADAGTKKTAKKRAPKKKTEASKSEEPATSADEAPASDEA
ncbi:MAG: trigger factor [Coriobacteriia bacterium]|nr:trigger factor [Coriobacteriia bacterium]